MSDEPNSTAHRRLIDEAMVQASEARREFVQARSATGVDERHRQALRNAVISYHDALKRYRQKSAVSDIWSEHQLDEIDRLTTETQTVTQPNPRVHGGATEQTEVPKLRLVRGDTLLQFLDGLDEVAAKLGFAAEVREQTPHEIGTKKDIRWLLKARDQTQALDELEGPEQDPEEVANA
jgi:hypothetical protein